MAIKRIQLRGISHTPSDNMSADGGCDESINFFADQQELAPTDTFSTVGDDVMPSGYDVFEVVFAHKTQSYTNYIYALYDDPSSLYDGAGLYTLDPANTDEPYSKILGFESGEGFDKIEAIGNTLIVLTDRRMLYVIFKDGEYTLLGDRIPEPRIMVRAVSDASETYIRRDVSFNEDVSVSDVSRSTMDMHASLCHDHSGVWNDPDMKKTIETYISKAMEYLNSSISYNADRNMYSLPLFVRYAVRLYDGRYVRHSAPILLDPNGFAALKEMIFKYSVTHVEKTSTVPLLYSVEMSIDRNNRETFTDKLLHPFHIQLDIDTSNRSEMAKWKDIISSVDVFVSPQVSIMSFEAGDITDGDWHFSGDISDWYGSSKMHAKILSAQEMEENVLAQSNFYKIHSIDIDDYITATESISTKDINDIYGDKLVVKPRLEDDTTRSNDKVRLLTANAYNGRIVSAGAEIEHYQGCYNFPSEKSESTQQQAYSVHFFMRGSGGQTIVVQKNYDASQYSRGPWLFYPDASCYKAVIRYVDIPNYAIVISMKEHPYLNGSYCFAGFGNNLPSLIPPASITLNTTEVLPNTIIQSESSNPFFFPLRHEFADKVTSIVPLTIPVSTGQFGYANLYAFTDGGIWTLNIMQDGSIGNVSAVSRDVAKAGSVCQLDQAIAFVSDRGLMLLAGSQIRCLSDKMLSRSFSVSQLDGFADLLREDSSYSHIAGVASDDMTFFDFIKDCAIVYDAAGNRLLMMKRFESGDVKGYCYAYHFASDTFGKCLTPYASNDKYNFSRALNSYPDAIVTFRKTNGHFMAVNCNRDNSAGRIETTSEHPCPVERCLLITRTINLDETYVRKRINDLRIRGTWDIIQPVGSEVRYILYGSMDGTSWQMLSSLRGSSYRFYRIVLLASLKPWDRISWIDIDYTTTFSGRVM